MSLISVDNHARNNLGIHILLPLDSQERLLIVAWNDLASRCPHELLQPLRRAEPRWMISRQPPLWDAVSPLFH